ncbi:hypothetical protein BU24DRAFT_448354 [Aaosphaeria arxii CBS 175.79]|uniref:Uncharacterized protein n=1 Tax=Aaosphaeria arxii CBS 175.79 TaxID=1450172 RepID=A0A6A5Y461_9PLEO|nr:uncharacterized protein BU24DRAFT_448354 [Aaosphaeria arxii CBS 175.79]KAF2019983.1 hypothetical protein BU24DRAFT_448354 [Aaosphaeria arxii CBS 175.79]
MKDISHSTVFLFKHAEIGLPFSISRSHSRQEAKYRKPLIAVEPRLTEQAITPGASVVSIPYGPFTTQPRSLRPEETLFDIQKPCTDCYIVAIHALIEDAINGTELLLDSGIWLHHIILFNPTRPDLVCPQMGERFYGGGNERWTRRWNSIGPWGYKIDQNDAWDSVVELMNDGQAEKTVNIVVRYEVVPADSEEGREYRGIRAVWLDVTGCGRGEVEVKSESEAFEYSTPNWESPISGQLVDVGGHMHDGGLNMTAYRNGDPICSSVQLYNNQASIQHIVAAGMCKNGGEIHKGDVLWADAKYDPSIHQLVFHNGKPDPVMGSMGVYIGL